MRGSPRCSRCPGRLPVSGELRVRRAVRGSRCPGEAPGARGTLPVRRAVGASRCPGDARGVGAAAGAQGTVMLRVPEPARSPPRRRSGAGRAGAQPGARSGSAAEAAPERDRRARGPRSHAPRCRGGGGAQTPLPCATKAIPALPVAASRAPGRRGAARRPREPTRACAHPPADPPRFGSRPVPGSPALCHRCAAPPRRQLRIPLCGLAAGAVPGGQEGLTRSEELAGGIPGLLRDVPAPGSVFLCEDTRPCRGRGAVPGSLAGSRRAPGDVCRDADLGRKAGSGASSAAVHHRLLSPSLWNCAGPGSPALPRERCRRGDGAGPPRAAPRLRAGALAALPSFPRRWMVPSDTAERFSS